ncbi:MAG: hypothetical protein EXR50_02165 [Dehalococcoidia bacterium]|nr:hypothetical protein [Dehalococcoidia bacterium]
MTKLSALLLLFLLVMALAVPFDANAAQRPGDAKFRAAALAAPTLRSPGKRDTASEHGGHHSQF